MEIEQVFKGIKKEWGEDSIQSFGDYKPIKWPVIPTGSYNLDRILRIGGWPQKRMVEIFGDESAGKTTIALMSCVEAQKLGYITCYIDMEQSVDISYAQALGLDVANNFFLSQPNSGDEALDIADKLIECEKIGIIVVDSVASLITQKEIECSADELASQMGAVARMLSFKIRQMNIKLANSNAVLMFINQTRPTIGVQSYIPLEHTPGGRALKFYASVRVQLKNSSSIKKDDIEIGKKIKATIIKHKLAPPKGKTDLDLVFGEGIDRKGEIFDWGVENGAITKEGQTYRYGKTDLGRGRDRAIETLVDLTGKFEEIENLLKSSIKPAV